MTSLEKIENDEKERKKYFFILCMKLFRFNKVSHNQNGIVWWKGNLFSFFFHTKLKVLSIKNDDEKVSLFRKKLYTLSNIQW